VKTLLTLGVAVALLFVLPQMAHGCAVCFSATDENRQAFLATTVLLTLLPLGMVGGVGLWARNRTRDLDRSEEITPDDPSLDA